LQQVARQAGAKGVLCIEVHGDTFKSPVSKHLTAEDKAALAHPDGLAACDGDLLLISVGPRHQCLDVLGRLRIHAAQLSQQKGLLEIDPAREEWLWVQDFPLVTRGDDGEWESTHHPFTAPTWEQEDQIWDGAMEHVCGQHYDLVLNGMEIGGGSIRVHNEALQRHILHRILGLEEAAIERSFGHLLEALKSGCPPHGGFAIGFDRLVAHLCGVSSIREVIAFPKTTTGQELLTGSPSALGDERLAELLSHHTQL